MFQSSCTLDVVPELSVLLLNKVETKLFLLLQDEDLFLRSGCDVYMHSQDTLNHDHTQDTSVHAIAAAMQDALSPLQNILHRNKNRIL